jgi:hypothetical protein
LQRKAVGHIEELEPEGQNGNPDLGSRDNDPVSSLMTPFFALSEKLS